MASTKRTCTGAVKNAAVAITDVEDGQTMSVTGKVLGKSAVMSLGCDLFSVLV